MDTKQRTDLWQTMVRIRRFEERVAELVEAKEVLTPCHLCIGQEAIAAGVCRALDRQDTIWGAHRSHGHYLAKGGELKTLMAEIFCREAGCSGGYGGSMHICAPQVGLMGTVPIVAATIPLAVGAALASSMHRRAQVAVSFFGDGATEEGHFHESLNLAALRKLPVIFVCENNLYSSHMPLLDRRARDNIAAAADAHGMPGEQLDGNDVLKVFQRAEMAILRARRGHGPTLLECRTFRWRGHVGPAWDLDVGVKRKGELQEWLRKDPVERCQCELLRRGVERDELARREQVICDEVTAAVEFARRASPPHAPVDQNVFASTEGLSRCG